MIHPIPLKKHKPKQAGTNQEKTEEPANEKKEEEAKVIPPEKKEEPQVSQVTQ